MNALAPCDHEDCTLWVTDCCGSRVPGCWIQLEATANEDVIVVCKLPKLCPSTWRVRGLAIIGMDGTIVGRVLIDHQDKHRVMWVTQHTICVHSYSEHLGLQDGVIWLHNERGRLAALAHLVR